jgi:serine protease AprX
MATLLQRAAPASAPRLRAALVSVATLALLLSVSVSDAAAQRRRSVIVTGSQAGVDAVAARHGAMVRKRLRTGAVLDLPEQQIDALKKDAIVHENHVVKANTSITVQATGADQLQAGLPDFGLGRITGRGVGVAVIDSGVAGVAELKDRIVARLDFTPRQGPGRGLDENGHGTHVAGIIASTGGRRRNDTRGMAPGAHIVSLKVLDAEGLGYESEVIEAIDWAVDHADEYRLRVINVSLGGPVDDGWRDDPLCQAVQRAHDAGLVVVASAGNFGRTPDGTPIYGAITTPGHCPHALTVGALNAKGTAFRSDDVMATYSSKGPTLKDRLIKPDVVAPGNKVVGLLAPGSTIAREHPELVLDTIDGKRLVLSGTSMSTAAVSGAAALLLDWTPRLAPVGVRLLLQATATLLPETPILASGAGSINVLAAVQGPETESFPATSVIAREDVV